MRISPHNYFEIFALLVCIFCWTKIRHTRFKWFLPFLAFIVALEFTGKYIGQVLRQPNAWLYNLSIPTEYLFYAAIFYLTFRSKVLRQVTLAVMSAYLVFTIIILLINGIHAFNSLSLLAGNLITVIFCCMFFIELLNFPERIRVLGLPMFWIAAGLLLFNLGELVYSTFHMVLPQTWDRGARIFKIVNNQLLLLLYTCIAIGLLCVEASRNSTRTSAQ